MVDKIKSEIYYFSGTGNSISLSRNIAKKFGHRTATIPINKIDLSGVYETDADVIGIVLPVYFLTIPKIIQRFARVLRVKEGAYLYGIASCGAHAGNVLYALKNSLVYSSSHFSYARIVYMPDNSIVFNTVDEEKALMLKNEEKIVDEIVADIKNRKKVRITNKFLWSALGKISRFSMNTFLGIKHKECDKSTCIKCGNCVKACPINSVSMKKGRFPVWNDQCEECFACINWCPNNSVKFGKLKANGRDFRHPEIKISDISQQKK